MNIMAQQINELDNVIKSLNEIEEDASVPRNVRLQIQNAIISLRQSAELSTKVNKALNELDEISSDVNLKSYTRTQVWNVMSTLEKLAL